MGKLTFLYMYLTGDSKLGPYLTLTLFFFKDKKISCAIVSVGKFKKKI